MTNVHGINIFFFMCIISTFNMEHNARKTSTLAMVVSKLRVCILHQLGPGLLSGCLIWIRLTEDLTPR